MGNLDIETRNLINLFSQTPEMFCLLKGPKHLFTFVNEAHIKVLGFDATGLEVRQAQPESVEVHGILDDVYTSGVTAHLRKISVTVGTSVRYFDLTYAARKNESGVIDGIMILGSEITETVLADKKVRESEEKLLLALKSGKMGLWHYDLQKNLITTSTTLNEILGLQTTNKDIDQVNELLIHPDDKEHVDLAWKRSVEEGTPYTKDYRIIKPTGEIRWISSTGVADYDEYRRPISFSGISFDITSIKNTEQKLKEALQFRDDFLSVASHELKTPLTSLKLQIQTSLRKFSRENYNIDKSDIETVFLKNNLQIDRLVRLVDDMLDLSRIQSGRLSYSFRMTNLADILRESYHIFRDQFEENGCALTLNLAVNEANGMYDRERIEQVLINLLTNAFKYGRNNPVVIELTEVNNNALIAVKDQGTGIAPENFEKVFRKFERAVTPSEVSGLGIGLYISREIVEAHGGKIWIESQLAYGTTFFVQFPLSR
ncbi:MAG: ATP-binding protein [Bdellovibrionota bacterium]